ncbi:unnamed protein product [Arabis nemorensis]|uniref:Pentacotripeptide-repeat region of PRORP domain-containing protein n=1 Tax=Arabis nemorensis TaxID=586526 RepID=A0A565AKV9_9BRAS|nr:unnamed protein product [Arabis nemorensis]
MSTGKLSRLFNDLGQKQSSLILNSDLETARKITRSILIAGVGILQSDPSLLLTLNSNVTRLVLSEPNLPTQSCIGFFNFLQRFESRFKPALTAVVTLSHRLYSDHKLKTMCSLLNSVAIDGFYERPIESLGLAMVDCGYTEEKFEFLEKFFDLMFRVYADNRMFEESVKIFDYILSKGLSIEERSCIVFLIAAKKSGKIDLCLEFFRRMVDSDVKITVYSLTIVVDGLCRRGEVEKSIDLIDEISRKGIKPEAFTYNTIINAYVKQRDFSSVEMVLKVMKKEKVAYNAATYTILIGMEMKKGRLVDAEKLFDEMGERGIESDIHVYTSLISWNCKKGDIKRAFLLFDELIEKGLSPSSHTYGALIDGVCRVGEMSAAEILVREMQCRGVNITQVVFNTLIDGYCRKGSIDDALSIYDVMEKKGFQADVFTYNTIASCLSKSKRYDEAKQWLFRMIDRGVKPNTVCYTNLIDIYCKEGNFKEAKKVFETMSIKGEQQPNVVTYNVMIDAYCKQGKVKEAQKLRTNMEAKRMLPDSFTYTSLILGEFISGNMDEATRLFKEMGLKGIVQRDVTYTAMISGFSKAGKSNEAFGLYREMKKKGYEIDNRVYTALVETGRLAGKEAAYFFQESKHAVNRIAEKSPTTGKKLPSSPADPPEIQPDVLPEILRHSLPSKIYGRPPDPSSLSQFSKWALESDPNAPVSISPDVLNPLRGYVSLPQVTFGRRRWDIPESENSVLASTANELRRDKDGIPVNPEKLKAAGEGLQHIGKAFAVATVIIFGSATLVFGTAASKLDVRNADDIRTKGKDLFQPKLESMKEQVEPLRTWAGNMSKKWHFENNDGTIKEKPILKELSKILGPKS